MLNMSANQLMLNCKSNFTKSCGEKNRTQAERRIMKRAGISVVVVLIVLVAVFFWLLSGSSPDNAPQEIKVIDLEDTYEK